MPIVAEEYQFVIGVDTHAASHSFAVIAPATRAVGQEAQFPATAAGLSRAVAWAGRDAGSPDVALVVVEGIGSYGAGVARAFTAAGYRIVEGGAQSVGDRRGTGKSDALDAVRIARSVIGTDTAQLREPRAEGIRNALRILIISREMMTRERTATVNALTALVRTTDLGLDARKALTIGQLRVIAAWRTRAGDAIDVAVARAEATRLARHALELGTHAAATLCDAPIVVKRCSCCSLGIEPGVVAGREFGVADLSALESGDGVDRPLEVLGDCPHRDSEGVPSRAQGADVGGRLGVGQGVVDLACDVSLEAADDVALGQALGGSAGDVVHGGLVAAGHADQDDAVERGIRRPVSAAVDAVAGLLAA